MVRAIAEKALGGKITTSDVGKGRKKGKVKFVHLIQQPCTLKNRSIIAKQKHAPGNRIYHTHPCWPPEK